MTYEEAKKWIIAISQKYIHGGDSGYDADRLKAIDIAIEALEKQMPQKPIVDENWCFSLLCPNCRTKLADTEHYWDKQKEMIIPHYVYCSKCGQAIDWSDLK